MTFPNFFEAAPTILMRDPLAQLLGSATEGVIEYHYVDVVKLAGHSCPTVAGAFLTARAALKALYPDSTPERGNISVQMPAPETQGTTGVVAQVLTLITGAATQGGLRVLVRALVVMVYLALLQKLPISLKCVLSG